MAYFSFLGNSAIEAQLGFFSFSLHRTREIPAEVIFVSFDSALGYFTNSVTDAFYQARFMYKLMNALNLPLAKQKGIVKFQIIQYASICEAILDMAITKYLIPTGNYHASPFFLYFLYCGSIQFRYCGILIISYSLTT